MFSSAMLRRVADTTVAPGDGRTESFFYRAGFIEDPMKQCRSGVLGERRTLCEAVYGPLCPHQWTQVE
jgi:hypothetical protein